MSEATPRPSRRRGRVRRARVLGAGAASVLAVVALGATTLPPAGETVVSSPNIPQTDTPEVAVAPTGEPETTETAEETPSPMPEPDPEPTSAPELVHEPAPAPAPAPTADPPPTPSVEPAVEPESDSERAARSHRNGAPLWGRRFIGVSVTENGQPKELVPGTEIRVSFAFRTDTEPHGGVVGHYGGCNSTTSPVHVEPDRLVLENTWGRTGRGCPDVEEQDAWLHRFIHSGPSWQVDGERLWLWSDDTIIEWVEDHRPPENR